MESIDSLALFPLSNVVLLPSVSVPLRLFEPRYLQMAHDVLADDASIGMVTVRPDAVTSMAGDPAIFDIGCLGRISQAQEQPDGTIQIVLHGVNRFRVIEEETLTEPRLYRRARVQLLEDEAPTSQEDLARLEQLRTDLSLSLTELVGRLERKPPIEALLEKFERLEPEQLINSLTQSITLESIERQQLLEANSIVGRFEIMCDLLRFRLAESGGSDFGSHRLPN